MDDRLASAPVVMRFADALRGLGGIDALWAAGSLATGGYRPGISDLDLVALAAHEPDPVALRDLHREFAAQQPNAAKLHCCYLTAATAADPSLRHPTWAHGRLIRRPLSMISRTELLDHGVTAFGPAPETVLPVVSDADLRVAARAELLQWRAATLMPWVWLDDAFVDIGLTTVARALATVGTGELIGKDEAIERLPALGVPDRVVADIRNRRDGRPARSTARLRIVRAWTARSVVARHIREVR